jgi:hypothetical protein
MVLTVNSDYFLKQLNQLIFVMVKFGVLFEVRTEFLNKFKGLNRKISLPEHVEQQKAHFSRPSRLCGPTVNSVGAPTNSLAKYLVGLLGAHLGLSPHHLKNSEDLVSTKDILVSFSVIALHWGVVS